MTSRILLALLALTGGLIAGALVPLGFAMSSAHERDYRTGTLAIAHTLAAAAEERIADHEKKSTMLPRALAALREENDEEGEAMTVAVVDDDGHVVMGADTGLYTVARARPAFDGHTEVTHLGDRLLAVVPVTGHDENVAGAVLLARPLGPLHDRVTRLWTRLAVVAAVSVAAAVILAVALARWVGRPLRRLEVAAESLGSGVLGARARPPRRPQEIRRLTERFNVMAARLETLIYDHRTVIADVSHQLRTPLAALRLRIELLADEAGPGTEAEFDGALEELGRLSRLIDGLLAVARAENSTAAPEPVDVTGLLAERAEAWRPVAAEREVGLSVSSWNHLTALAGAGHLEQVIDNLVDNALTATPSGGHVRLTARAADHVVRVAVADDGPGMPEAEMADAFHRFRTGRAAGTGLGLAIVHRLVTADGGQVRLSRTPGGGLTVTIDVPAAR